MSRLVITTVSFNSSQVLPGLLDSIEAGLAGVSDYSVVVVDNNSTDDSVAVARSHPVGAEVIASKLNKGYSGGINLAMQSMSHSDHLLVLNPDIRLLPGTAKQLMGALADPTIGLVVPRTHDEHGVLLHSLRREPSLTSAWAEAVLGGGVASRLGAGEAFGQVADYQKARDVDWASGCALLISARARQVVGPWDESFFLYSEEVDYCHRVRQAGYRVRYVPEAEVLHLGGEYSTNPRLYALHVANRVRYYGRHHGPASTALYAAGIALGEAIRSARRPIHRVGVMAALAPRRRYIVTPTEPATAE